MVTHPDNYYPRQTRLNFSERTGTGVFHFNSRTTLAKGRMSLSVKSFCKVLSVKWYMKCFIYWTADLKFQIQVILHGLIRTHKWPAPNVSGFIAQLVRASHRYREVTGSNPVEVLTFSIRSCLNCDQKRSYLFQEFPVVEKKKYIYNDVYKWEISDPRPIHPRRLDNLCTEIIIMVHQCPLIHTFNVIVTLVCFPFSQVWPQSPWRGQTWEERTVSKCWLPLL